MKDDRIKETVVIGQGRLSIEDVVSVARYGARIEIGPEVKQRIDLCWETLLKLVKRGDAIYGVTTGIGELARIRISADDSKKLQKRIIFSHSAGYGDILPEEEVRGAIITPSILFFARNRFGSLQASTLYFTASPFAASGFRSHTPESTFKLLATRAWFLPIEPVPITPILVMQIPV